MPRLSEERVESGQRRDQGGRGGVVSPSRAATTATELLAGTGPPASTSASTFGTKTKRSHWAKLMVRWPNGPMSAKASSSGRGRSHRPAASIAVITA